MGTLLVAAAIFVAGRADSVSARTTFALADLEGRWNVHGLRAGGPVDLQGWIYGTVTCDRQGRFERQWTDSRGHTSKLSGILQMDSDGILTALGGGPLFPTYHGAMNVRKDTWVLTGTDSGGGCFLIVGTKSVGTFATSDLAGKWVWHGLASGPEVGEASRWWYGSLTFDAHGNGVSNSPFVNSEGPVETLQPLQISMGSDGIITSPFGISSAHGAMNPGKDLMVSVNTVVVGHTDDSDIPGEMLVVWEKQGTGYTPANLAGTWYVHALVSGSWPDWTGWYHLASLSDRQGRGEIVSGSYLNSHGETSQTATAQTSIASDGVVRMSNLPSFHGMMDLRKDLWVGTMNDGGGGYGLAMAIGRPVDEFDFNADGRVDFLDLAIFAGHWLN